MFFVTAFLLGVGLMFLIKGIKGGNNPSQAIGVSFLIAALGTGVITWLAISAMNV